MKISLKKKVAQFTFSGTRGFLKNWGQKIETMP